MHYTALHLGLAMSNAVLGEIGISDYISYLLHIHSCCRTNEISAYYGMSGLSCVTDLAFEDVNLEHQGRMCCTSI